MHHTHGCSYRTRKQDRVKNPLNFQSQTHVSTKKESQLSCSQSMKRVCDVLVELRACNKQNSAQKMRGLWMHAVPPVAAGRGGL